MIRRLAGAGWLALLGGGEFSFGETLEADRAWLARTGDGTIGFLPTASGSADYGRHFTEYLVATFDRQVDVVPIYRTRDARRGKNLERIAASAALYLGGGVAEDLVDAVRDTPATEALVGKLRGGGVVVAMAAAAQALGQVFRGLLGAELVPGLGWLPQGAVEPNFTPAHDRRLRRTLAAPQVDWGLGIPAGSAVLLGPDGEVEVVGTAFVIEDAEGDLRVLGT